MIAMILLFIVATVFIAGFILLMKGLTARQAKYLIKVLGLFGVSSVIVLILALVLVSLF